MDMVSTESFSFHKYANSSFECCVNQSSCSQWQQYEEREDKGSLALRISISVVYSLVCAVGLVGNVLVLHLLRTGKHTQKSSINLFVFNLAVTDFQFVLVLPFWAVEMALDFSWPFGLAMCKIIPSLTVLNAYTSVFFLTAMSVTRYCSVATALKPPAHIQRLCTARWISSLIWLVACLATVPTAVFTTLDSVGDDQACLLRLPRNGFWLAIYHLQKIVLGFLIPLAIILICYLLLLRFLKQQHLNYIHPERQNKVTKSVMIVVLSFFICWLPNHVITFWGVLVKLLEVDDTAYNIVHEYVFPVTICLAHTNSCLNPLIYCLMRKEFRKALKTLFWRLSAFPFSNSCLVSVGFSVESEGAQVAIPLNPMESHSQQAFQSYTKRSLLPSSTATAVHKNTTPVIVC
ncbi:relaxin-3 receptor 1-like [Acipenser ruthenus]|uniref:relaxin-3 receptor 1-like n=1 Tax=Acipenser ruthenus TaxID=7906 RepID=UPI0015605F7C|nr:relaxin-3 receptor 1-like [Acipenser ruthenus]